MEGVDTGTDIIAVGFQNRITNKNTGSRRAFVKKTSY